ncbi:hypothetical protein GPECTOR_108g179 [Gonium pectorale]|uniref:Uncharacterized protein n=1 Tax=Gonium pectorale TaxID=33097 RepID=A0A150FZG5_GONPE|nr:hypothetical protein GPECTOR_108g179 [Gonium pectorale]|eukprot:KXZ42984.1 hypothetical protein GPECTOR_108g179 [Gonium pectorale]
MQNIYFAYFNKSGIAEWSPELDQTPYRETRSYYAISVNGRRLATMKDLKDSGLKTPETSMYSLKATLNSAILPSTTPYRVVVHKVCESADGCARVPDPATVFLSPTGHFVWSAWNVRQSLYVNGTLVRDHAWCPVQTVVNVP